MVPRQRPDARDTPAHQFLRRFATYTGIGGDAVNHEPTMWLRAQINDVRGRYLTGAAFQCGHLAGRSIAFVPLWHPDQFLCSACMAELPTSATTDHTCDRCGTLNLGTRGVLVDATPRILLALGLCPPCYAREVPR